MAVYAQIYIDEVISNGMQSWLKPMLWAMAITIGCKPHCSIYNCWEHAPWNDA